MNEKRTAIVTGGGQGIGRSVALALAARGDAVVVSGRSIKPLESVAREIRARGGEAHAHPADVRNGEAVNSLFDETAKRYGIVEIIVTCAVQSRVSDFTELSDEDWINHFDTKVLGTVRCVRRAIPQMSQRGWGRIVILAGTSARKPARGRITNGATNAAVTNLGKYLAQQYAEFGILINTVHPGLTDTPRLSMLVESIATERNITVEEAKAFLGQSVPTKQLINPDEIADLIEFLCSNKNKSITGQTIAVDGGLADAVTY